jgi:SPP1 gp7 family putative phage head morphogenesis protein
MASRIRRRKDRTEKTLRPVHPNAGIAAAYQRKLDALIDELHASIMWWLRAEYRANPPKTLAQDESSAEAMRKAIRKLTKRWLAKFDEAAEKLAAYFAQSVSARSDAALKKILKDGGISVEWKMTAAQREVLSATVQENVALIKSIPQRYLEQVEGVVMRSVQTGRDLKQLTDDLQKQFGVTKRRAAFIARDQNNKATAALNRARQLEIGVEEAIWVHSHAGKHPRPSHVKAGRDKVRYRVDEGWLDPAINKRIWPGTEIKCRCVGKPVIRGFS